MSLNIFRTSKLPDVDGAMKKMANRGLIPQSKFKLRFKKEKTSPVYKEAKAKRFIVLKTDYSRS